MSTFTRTLRYRLEDLFYGWRLSFAYAIKIVLAVSICFIGASVMYLSYRYTESLKAVIGSCVATVWSNSLSYCAALVTEHYRRAYEDILRKFVLAVGVLSR